MKSIKNKQDIDKILKESVSDLSKKAEKMWEWLIGKPDKNTIKSQFRKDFQDIHLEMAFLRMKDILPYSDRLATKRLYTIFNAQTVKPFLDQLLSINEKPNAIKQFTHDFRTVELARMMFELSSKYLMNLTNSNMVRDDLQRVSEHFKIQSENKLENETYAIHGNNNERIFTEKKEQSLLNEKIKLIQTYYNLKDDEEVKRLEKGHSDLSLDQRKQNYLKSKQKLEKKQVKQIENKIRRNRNQLDEIDEQLRDIEENVLEKISNIESKLESKYDHLSSFASALNFLPEFLNYVLENNFTIPEPNDGTTIIVEPHHKLNKSEIKMNKIKYKRILKNHDKIKWLGTSTSTSITELRKYPPLNRFQPSGILSIVPIIDAK